MPINLTEVAKDLRKSMTDAERALWQRLKAKQLGGLKFRRQEQIGRYIADFDASKRGSSSKLTVGSMRLKEKETMSGLNG